MKSLNIIIMNYKYHPAPNQKNSEKKNLLVLNIFFEVFINTGQSSMTCYTHTVYCEVFVNNTWTSETNVRQKLKQSQAAENHDFLKRSRVVRLLNAAGEVR